MSSLAEESNSFSTHATSTGEKTSGSSNIHTYLRMRPMAGRCEWHSVTGEDGKIFVINLPRDERDALQNARGEYKFRFDGIFDQEATQEEVFQSVALPVVDDALRGINGTIFAYGQTGTGKTYTITGDAEAFEMRGIIPRAIARVFEHASECSSAEFNLAISYLEIYQDRGYDLLFKAETGSNKLEDLRRVYAVTDEKGQIVLRGLSVNPVRTEEDALNLLFVGDANRIVAETPLNDCSTRSHCIFTIWIASKDHGSHTTRRAKLHLVDLAGSERVKQSGTRPGDCVFQEACSINLTLHYLEQVIVALQQKSAGHATHIPYRNSLMTSVLKDSLGGNCKTRMIATVALESYAIQETINTCRFAQAVAQIENVAAINEEEELTATVQRLQRENERLRGQLQLATISVEGHVELTEETKELCKNSVEQFLRASDDDLELPVTAARDLRSADYCFRVMREKFREATSHDEELPCKRRECRESLKKLQLHVEQRDAEIATLLGILHHSSDPSAGSQVTDPFAAMTRAAVEAAVRGPQHNTLLSGKSPIWLTGPEATALLKDRGRAFEILRRSARKAELLEADSQQLNRLYEDAKTYTKSAEKAKANIAEAKAKLEKFRIRKLLYISENIPHDQNSQEEADILRQLTEWRDEYIKNMDALKSTERELNRVHVSVERSRKKLQQDFESWFNVVASKHMRLPLLLHQQDQTCEPEISIPALKEHKQSQMPHLRKQDSIEIRSATPEGTAPYPVAPLLTPREDCLRSGDGVLQPHCIRPEPSVFSGTFSSGQSNRESQSFTEVQSRSQHISTGRLVATAGSGEPDIRQGRPSIVHLISDKVSGVSGTILSKGVCVSLDTSCSGLSGVDTQQDSNTSVYHTKNPVPQDILTGNESADNDIKAFYEAMGTSTCLTTQE